MRSTIRSKIVVPCLVAIAGLLPLMVDTGSASEPRNELGIVIEKIVGPERCAECHQAEHAVWLETAHRKGFLEMHRREGAEAIRKKLGLRRIKTAESCVRCHYTPMEKRGKIRAAEGVSCESCHGAARDWIDIHDGISDIEGEDEAETARLQQAAIDRCKTNGMRRPDDIYVLARACFACHVVDDQTLVNIGGHGTGDTFELLSWSQGEIRHNYLRSSGAENALVDLDRKRVLYVLGQTLDLEHTLRALGKHAAPAKHVARGVWRTALQARAAKVRGRLAEISKLVDAHPQLTKILDAVRPAIDEMSVEDLAKAADVIQTAARRFAAEETGRALKPIDSLLPAPATYCGNASR